jgi:hypothetical protein
MYNLPALTVIRKSDRFGSDTGIICGLENGFYRIMFETANRGVEFRNYSVGSLRGWAVIG